MPNELRRLLTVLVLLVATMAGQPRWLERSPSEDAAERPLQRELEVEREGSGESIALPARSEGPASRPEAIPLAVPAIGLRLRPTTLRGAGAPRAPDAGLAA